MYAIVATGGKQYKVTKGDVVKLEKLNGEAGDRVVFDKVLLISDDKVTVGNPYISEASVEGRILEQGKDKKVIVYKYKSKTGYHKKNGHRQPITTVEIDKVILNGTELVPDEPVEEAEEAAADVKAAEDVKEAAAEENVVEAAEETAAEEKAVEAAEEKVAEEKAVEVSAEDAKADTAADAD